MHLTTGHLKYVRQKLIALQGETDESTITGGVFSTPLSDTDESSRQKISKDTDELNNTINQLYIINICRLFHPTTAENTFVSRFHGTFTKFKHILSHKTHLKKFKKKIEVKQR